MPVDDASVLIMILVATGVGAVLLGRGIAWLGDRATNWDGDLDR